MRQKSILTIRVFMAISAGLLGGCSRAPTAVPATPEEIKSRIEASAAPVLLIHAWATWCQPCREEFPELMQVLKRYRREDIAVLLVSADDPDDPTPVETFLAEHQSPVDSLVSTTLDQNFIETLSPNWSGALPATFLFGANGNLIAEWEGKKDCMAVIPRWDFYERASKAYAVIATSESALFANIILTKGIVKIK